MISCRVSEYSLRKSRSDGEGSICIDEHVVQMYIHADIPELSSNAKAYRLVKLSRSTRE